MDSSTYEALKEYGFELAPFKPSDNPDRLIPKKWAPLPANIQNHYSEDWEYITDAVIDEKADAMQEAMTSEASTAWEDGTGDWRDNETALLAGVYNSISTPGVQIRVYDYNGTFEYDSARGLKQPLKVDVDEVVYVVSDNNKIIYSTVDSEGGLVDLEDTILRLDQEMKQATQNDPTSLDVLQI